MERSTPSPASVRVFDDARLAVIDASGGGVGGMAQSLRRALEEPELDEAARAVAAVFDRPDVELARVRDQVYTRAWKAVTRRIAHPVMVPSCGADDACDPEPRRESHQCQRCWLKALIERTVREFCEVLLRRARRVARHPRAGCEDKRRLRRIGLAVALWAPSEFLLSLSIVDRCGALTIPHARDFDSLLTDSERTTLHGAVEARLETIVDKKVKKRYGSRPGTVSTADDWVAALLVDTARAFDEPLVHDAARTAKQQFEDALHDRHAVRRPSANHPVAREFARRLVAWADLSTSTTFQQLRLVLSANADSWQSFARFVPSARR